MKGQGKGWRGESRRHSMARKGIGTARGTFERYPPQIMEETSAMYFDDFNPKVFCDRGAGDGEPFCWIDFGDIENYPDYSQYVVVMDYEDYEVVGEDGVVYLRTQSFDEAIKKMKELYIEHWEIDAINSPMGSMLGWVEKDKGELTKEGKEVYKDFKEKIMSASGIESRKSMEKSLWHMWNDMNPNATNEEVRGYKEFIAKKSDDDVQESYERQVAINKPLSKTEMKMIDEGLDDVLW